MNTLEPRDWAAQRAEGRSSARMLGRALAVVIVVVAAVAGGLVARAVATEPRTTYTASSTELVITYGAGADSIDVNVRYPDGTSFNYHPNRGAGVGEVLTIPLTARPAWVQVHTTNCHLGEPSSPGYGTDCRYIEETPCPTETTAPSPEPSAPVTASPEPSPSTSAPTPAPTSEPEPTSSPSPTVEPSATPTPSPEPSASSPSPVASPSPSPSSTPGTPSTPSASPTPTTPPENYNQGDYPRARPTDDATYTSGVSAVDHTAATAAPALATTGLDAGPIALLALVAILVGAIAWGLTRKDPRP